LLAQLIRVGPALPLRAWLREAGRRLRPPRLENLAADAGPRVRAALARGEAAPSALARVRREGRVGGRPTLVLGGFVPGAVEQVYLLREYLSRRGALYYVDYAAEDFSVSLLAAQLDDLVEQIGAREGARPVVLAVSFGAGLVLDWLRRARLAGGAAPRIAGLLLVSPVCGAADLLPVGGGRPETLLGRALEPVMTRPEAERAAAVERARAVFVRMFEAGSQNRAALAGLLTRAELRELRAGVRAAINGVSVEGAVARVRAMREMACPSTYLTPELLPLAECPALLLYAEKEDAVLGARAPGRAALERSCTAFFPRGRVAVVRNAGGAPVQHASLIFHGENFLPWIAAFYRGLKCRKSLEAA
jgi:alpha-beta hydrolase superfamily lysophospholipase